MTTRLHSILKTLKRNLVINFAWPNFASDNIRFRLEMSL